MRHRDCIKYEPLHIEMYNRESTSAGACVQVDVLTRLLSWESNVLIECSFALSAKGQKLWPKTNKSDIVMIVCVYTYNSTQTKKLFIYGE